MMKCSELARDICPGGNACGRSDMFAENSWCDGFNTAADYLAGLAPGALDADTAGDMYARIEDLCGMVKALLYEQRALLAEASRLIDLLVSCADGGGET